MSKVSYGVRVKNINRCLKETVSIYNDAVSYLIDIAILHYNFLSQIEDSNSRQREFEKLIHSTKNNNARYPEFDKRFYKFPAYFRRSALSTAYGDVDSWMKLVNLWEQNNQEGAKPRLKRNQHNFPCFFYDNMSEFYDLSDSDIARIKVYHNNDWVWMDLKLRQTDLYYLAKLITKYKTSKLDAPVVVKRNKHYELRFACDISYPKAPRFAADIKVRKVVGVDLGVNTDAVCSLVNRDGTVTGCSFINHSVEKDRLYKLLNVIKKNQQKGNRKMPRLWAYVNNYNEAIAKDTAKRIVDYALNNEAEVIVFEHLNIHGKIRGSKAQRIALWKKREIQSRTEILAKRMGIRVTYICPYNTSKYAFDGSGEVMRGKDAGFATNKLCKFKNGKVYNCDLSASKNVAARYLLRCYEKSMSKRSWLQAQAKVPGLSKRTDSTLSTLISLNAITTGLLVCG